MGGIDRRRAERAAAWMRGSAVLWSGVQLLIGWSRIPSQPRTVIVAVVAVLAAMTLIAAWLLRGSRRRLWHPLSVVFTAVDVAALLILTAVLAPAFPAVWALSMLAPFVAALRCGVRGAIGGGASAIATVVVVDLVDGLALADLVFHVGLLVVTTTLSTLMAREVTSEHDRLSRNQSWQRRLIDVLAHDVRAPLASASLAIATVRHRPDLDDPDALLTIADRQIRRAQRLSDYLLDLAQAEVGELPLHPRPTRVAEVCRAAVATAGGLGDVEVRVDDELLAFVDPDRLEQVLVNLVTNALRHGRRPIVVAAHRRQDRIEIEVVDQGPGVPADVQAELFTRYPAGRAPTSIGLGLWIARLVVDASGGRLRYAPHPQVGARFVIDLPADAPHGADPGHLTPAAQRTSRP